MTIKVTQVFADINAGTRFRVIHVDPSADLAVIVFFGRWRPVAMSLRQLQNEATSRRILPLDVEASACRSACGRLPQVIVGHVVECSLSGKRLRVLHVDAQLRAVTTWNATERVAMTRLKSSLFRPEEEGWVASMRWMPLAEMQRLLVRRRLMPVGDNAGRAGAELN